VQLSPGQRSGGLNRRLVGQAGEFQVRPVDPPRQRDPLLQMLGLAGPGGPALRVTEADQRERAQFFAQGGLCRLRAVSHRAQPPGLLGLRRQVPASARDTQPDDSGQQLRLGAPRFRHGPRRALGQTQVPVGLRERPVGKLVGRDERRELGVGREDVRREAG
jgi:hypothetical protein